MHHGHNPTIEQADILSRGDLGPCPVGGELRRRPQTCRGYGAIFGDLPHWKGVDEDEETTVRALGTLAKVMLDTDDNNPVDDNPDIPAGFTYLGQFVVHDLTHLHQAPQHHLNGANTRTPSLDLDCLYGRGPEFEPILYQRNEPDGSDFRFLLRTGLSDGEESEDRRSATFSPIDIARITETTRGLAGPDKVICADPLIADPRNDDHVIISQLHLAFTQLHNRVALCLKERGLDNRTVYKIARSFVTTCYQDVVKYDYLPRMLCPPVYRDLIEFEPDFVKLPDGSPLKDSDLPLEFSLAVGRAGHAMVRGIYRINSQLRSNDQNLREILRFTGLSDNSAHQGKLPLPKKWVVDWANFFKTGLQDPLSSRKLSPFVASKLVERDLPFSANGDRNLLYMDLWRSYRPGLPTGQVLAQRIAQHVDGRFQVEVLEGDSLLPSADATGQKCAAKAIGETLRRYDDLLRNTPLFYYVLQEANLLCDGRHLGPVGSFIMAVTFRQAMSLGSSETNAKIKSMSDLIKLINASEGELEAALDGVICTDPLDN